MDAPVPARPTTAFFDRRNMLIVTAISIAYLLLSAWLLGFKSDQLWLIAIFNVCYYISRPTRRFILGFSIFIFYWIVFDYMKAFPNYLTGPVHIKDIYETEKAWFGVTMDGVRVTPNEYWLHHTQVWLDVLTGSFYLCWVPVPLAFAAYLFYKDRLAFLHFAFTFILVNWIGYIIYYTYPAAPPWYVQLHGFDFIASTPGNTAGLARFDTALNVNIFGSLYAKGSNVFAAMPSLHSAYPLIVFFYARKTTNLFFTTIFGIIALGIWFSAVYTSHHYVLDVLAGIACASTGIALYRLVLMRSVAYNERINKYYSAVTK
ncbi:phosphatase PAP2 family protein [Chitinophaga ginsengisoli]|uniref:PAP2 superfamily protein n=1 Tax=Chitinophaga ginsengisoli TaxID=363837 RepID=A0A2P8GAB9_9BACT|nr:phosphatase PAP2 family protein [Chitinophaga ginsengisoli]PSL30898.1 PAP2 superfamily protein [Chitinophaga ginsengisoli]